MILLYLGAQHGLAPKDPAGGLWTHQIQLTIADLVNEAHDTHHPVGVGLYYEDQKDEALRRAKEFRQSRIPNFFDGSRRSWTAIRQAATIWSAPISPTRIFRCFRSSKV